MLLAEGRHYKWIQAAIKLAQANPNPKHKHAAILVASGRVLSFGLNSERAAFYPSRHAEWAAVREHLDSKGVLYVARVNKAGEACSSAPCSLCLNTLVHYTNIKAVAFTLSLGVPDSFDLSTMRKNNAKVSGRR